MKKLAVLIGAVFALVLMAPQAGATGAEGPCIGCHAEETPGIVKQWRESKHSKLGVKCYVCHKAKKDDPAGREHNGYFITPLVTPYYCQSCHAREVKEFKESLHDEAGFFSTSALTVTSGEKITKDHITLGQTRNYKANFSRESAEAGCLHCHGTEIKVANDGALINWPNNGIGRFNPDGSVGSCSACHTRHTFSIAQARKPETCGQCHLGPDHPQIEIYEESKHGNLYAANGEKWNWDAPAGQWGPDDIGAPTCVTCHMSGFGGAVKTTHNVSARLKWELEPAFSWPTEKKYLNGKAKYPIEKTIARRYEKINGIPAGTLAAVKTGLPNPFAMAKKFSPDIYKRYVGPGKWWSVGTTRADAFGGDATRSPGAKREDMVTVCVQCHAPSWVNGELAKAEQVVQVYNAVALGIKKKYYDPIKKEKLDADIKFNGKSGPDTLWHEIWHHEGRRWRMGAFMQGPDYEHWLGSYEITVDGNRMANWLDELRVRKATKKKLGLK